MTNPRNTVARELALRLLLEGLSYAEIGPRVGVSRARVHQWLRCPPALQQEVVRKARGRCTRCGIRPARGHVHSPEIGRELEGYKGDGPLTYLCLSCARIEHQQVKAEGGNLCGECLEVLCPICGGHKRDRCRLADKVCRCTKRRKRL